MSEPKDSRRSNDLPELQVCVATSAAISEFERVMAEGEKTVSVPYESLKHLYECAESFDVRIPDGNGSSWAEPFRLMFEKPEGAGE